uniref:Uncharacterized protein n=1 Tax=Fundidesulfovibrio putealis TaxID=270496 RepID=A0A7C3WCG2_9BACT
MIAPDKHFQPLYDQDKNLLGIWLSPEMWTKCQSILSPAIDKALAKLDPKSQEPAPEPMKDWQALIDYWDLPYPLPMDVHCDNCGNATQNWQEDEPRLFRLRTANIGGLANFECQKCRARVIKKHFKKHVDVECRPFVEK